jgi:hypothetical protein
MAEIACFMLDPTGWYRIRLRRFVFSSEEKCPATKNYHDAETVIGKIEAPDYPVSGDLHPHDDPLWPKACRCGYEFLESDQWQLTHSEVYRRRDCGDDMTLFEAPAGAMWYADWLINVNPSYSGPDGRCLVVKTPGGEWYPDRLSRQGRPWSRAGDPPDVTASPSILITDVDGNETYHGWLRNGRLESC